jgi:hypothetical protein
MQQSCSICIHGGSATVVHEIYGTSCSKTEFCEMVPGQKGPTLDLSGGEVGIHLSGFANSQQQAIHEIILCDVKAWCVTCCKYINCDWDWTPPPFRHQRTTAIINASGSADQGQTPPNTVKLQTNFELGNNQCIYRNKSLKKDNWDTHFFSRSTHRTHHTHT